MTNKARRNYRLQVATREDPDLFVTADPPTTIEFDITQKLNALPSDMNITIYNLSENNRNAIFHDGYDYDIIRRIILDAGYGSPTVEQIADLSLRGIDARAIDLSTSYAGIDPSGSKLSTVFDGQVTSCLSVRQGTNFLTKITAFSAATAYSSAHISETIQAGYSDKESIEQVLSNLKKFGISKGVIGDYQNISKRAQVYSGNPIEIANTISNGGFFIYNDKYYVLADSECIEGTDIDVIDSSTGLLSTPAQEGQYIHVEMIFEPRIIMGQLIYLNSATAPHLNGPYKVMSLTHRGTISEAVSGTAITTVGLFKGVDRLFTVNS